MRQHVVPEQVLERAHGLLVLRGEAAQLSHQEQHVGTWSRQQVAAGPLLTPHVCLGDQGAEKVRGVHDVHVPPVPPAAPHLAGSGHRGGPELGEEAPLAQDAVPCGTLPGPRLPHQDEPQPGLRPGVFPTWRTAVCERPA